MQRVFCKETRVGNNNMSNLWSNNCSYELHVFAVRLFQEKYMVCYASGPHSHNINFRLSTEFKDISSSMHFIIFTR